MKWNGIKRGSLDIGPAGDGLLAINTRFKVAGELRRRRGLARTSIQRKNAAVTTINGFSAFQSNVMAALTDGDRIQGYQQPYSLWQDNPTYTAVPSSLEGFWFDGDASSANLVTDGLCGAFTLPYFAFTSIPFDTSIRTMPFGTNTQVLSSTTALAGGRAQRASCLVGTPTAVTFGAFMYKNATLPPRVFVAPATEPPYSQSVSCGLGYSASDNSKLSLKVANTSGDIEESGVVHSLLSSDTAFSHFAISWRPAEQLVVLYRDGVMVENFTYSITVAMPTNPTIGVAMQEGPSTYTQGQVCGVFFADGILPYTEIEELAAGYTP